MNAPQPHPRCILCFGTGNVPAVDGKSAAACLSCRGSGVEPVQLGGQSDTADAALQPLAAVMDAIRGAREVRQTPQAITHTLSALKRFYALEIDQANFVEIIAASVREGSYRFSEEHEVGYGFYPTATLAGWNWLDADCTREDAVMLLGEGHVFRIERQVANGA